MITFLTLYLGLVTGTVPVEVGVGPEVARVELLLDGRPVAARAGPPWVLVLDLGEELSPHRLEAVARDGQGREVGRAVQLLNLPRPPAEAALLLEAAGAEGGRRARLAWESPLGDPEQIEVTFDGAPLPVADPRSIPLPAHDPAQLHLLRADLVFGGRVSATAELVFGGVSDRVAETLTAVPVRLRDEGPPPIPADLTGSLAAVGRELPVVALEEGPVEVVVVPGGGVREALQRLAARSALTLAPSQLRLRQLAQLPRDHRLRILWPVAERHGGAGVDFDVFPPSPELSHLDGGLYWLLAGGGLAVPAGETQRLADAVAVAGTLAAAHNRRRVVVALEAPGNADGSRLPAPVVARYLARLRVPLEVWRVGEEEPAGESGFGAAQAIRSLTDLGRAVRQLTRQLDRQRIAWVEGRYLPQEVQVTAGAMVAAVTEPPAMPAPPVATGRERVVAALLSGARPPVAEAPEGAERPEPPRLDPAVPQGEALEPGPERVLAPAGAYLRSAPAADAGVVTRLDVAAELPVLERRPGWLRVRAGSLLGWLPEDPVAALSAPRPGAAAAHRHTERKERARELLGESAWEGELGPWELLTDLPPGGLSAELAAVARRVVPAYRDRYGIEPRVEERDTVVLFARGEGYRRFRAGEVGAEDLPAHAGGGLAAVAVEGLVWDEAARLLVHELAHLLAEDTLGGDLPPWLEEGLAEDLAWTVVVAPPVRPGRPVTGLAGALARVSGLRLLSAADLTALSREDFHRPAGRGLHYAHSGLLVRFLLEGGPPRRSSGFRTFLGALAAGAPAGPELLFRYLEEPPVELDRAFRAWLDREVRAQGLR